MYDILELNKKLLPDLKEIAKKSAELSSKQAFKQGVAEATTFGATAGFGAGLEQKDRTAKDVLKSTATGAVVGAGLGAGIGVGGKLASKLLSRKATQKTIASIENKIGKLEGEEKTVIRQGLEEGLEEKQIIDEIQGAREQVEVLTGEPKVEPTKEVIPTKETPKVEPTTKKTIPEKKPIKKVEVPDKKKSRFAQRLNEELPDNLKIDEDIDVAHLKKEAESSAALIAKDTDKAVRIASGVEKSNANTQTATSIALAEKAKQAGDWEAVSSLYNTRRLANTRRGQEINMEKLSIALNPEERYMRQVIDAKTKNVKVGIDTLKKGETKTTKVNRKVGKNAETFKKDMSQSFKVNEAQTLLDNITCK